jgi:urea carboxylase-associated protein 2
MSETGDPKAAREHARAQGGTQVESMPVLPPSPGLIWEETIAPGGYASKRLDRGACLTLTDVKGDGCISLLIFNAEMPTERLNVADTTKVQWNAYLSEGSLLLSDMGRVLMSIVQDSAGTHDPFCGASTEASNAAKYGDGANFGEHPNARDRLMIAAGKYGLGRKDVHPCLNLFKGVKVMSDGTTRFVGGPSAPSRQITLRAEMNVIVVMANCPHVLDPRGAYTVRSVQVTAKAGCVTPLDDEIRNATPEGLRAFLNVEDYYAR